MKTRILWQHAADVDWAEDLSEVADKPWWFFHLPNVQNQLHQLPWSFQDCCARITPKGKGVGIQHHGLMPFRNLFSSQGILQLALWTTTVFHEAPEAYIYAPASRSRAAKLHKCPQRPELFDAIADVLLWYEYRCRYVYDELGYEMCRAKINNAIETLDLLPTILERLNKKQSRPENPGLKYQHNKIRQALEYMKEMASLLTENDYSRAGGAVQGHPDRGSRDIKTKMVCDMREAFQRYGPMTLLPMETYRSIAEILNTFGVQNQQDGKYTDHGVKRVFLRRPTDPWAHFWIERMDWTINEMLRQSE